MSFHTRSHSIFFKFYCISVDDLNSFIAWKIIFSICFILFDLEKIYWEPPYSNFVLGFSLCGNIFLVLSINHKNRIINSTSAIDKHLGNSVKVLKLVLPAMLILFDFQQIKKRGKKHWISSWHILTRSYFYVH